MKKVFRILLLLVGVSQFAAGRPASSTVSFSVTPDLTQHLFHVVMSLENIHGDTILLKMPAWTPGYYQLLHFADRVTGLTAADSGGAQLTTVRSGRNGWKVASANARKIQITYDVTTTRAFVAMPFVNDDRAYVSPPGVFLYVSGELSRTAEVNLELPPGWKAATGLDAVGTSGNRFVAANFDVLYDSPILMGDLEELPSFDIRGIPHRFIGYKLGDFDRVEFMKNLKRVVEASINLMSDIPYKQYTFLAIGPGPGGIEHLNSTSFGFSGESLKSREGSIRMFTFLAHEYFHHYNVKRIRPIELGPFDYERENRTNLLWVAEGFTVYYDLLLTHRAGLMTQEEFFAGISSRIASYENKPGKRFQSATQASYNTWSDGPFGRTDDEVNKTVSVYDKGAALGLLLDLAIRNATANKKSLDEVMRVLYKDYYQEKKRGFSESEFRSVVEQTAGTPMTQLFEYASTTQPVDYPKYFEFAALSIDDQPKVISGGWLGITAREKNDSLVVSSIDYESPAWNAGVRRNMTFLSTIKVEPVIATTMPGASVALDFRKLGKVNLVLGKKQEASFEISQKPNPTNLQKAILHSWLSGAQ